jgi:ABC-type uncharacterized transport system involved in gliding motility auxiliary subunit
MPGASTPTSFSARRKWSIVFSVLVSILAFASLVAMINYLGARHFVRFQLSNQASAPLSPQTLGLLKSLTNQVKVIRYYSKKAPLYDYVSRLLDEYSHASPNILLEPTVDYLTDPATALKIKETYHLGSAEAKDLVIFDSNGRTKVIDGKALGDYTITPKPDENGERQFERRLRAFRGEAYFSSAILSVSKPRQLKAYFLAGHHENNPNDETQLGYSKFNEILRNNYVDTELLSLAGTNVVPADCKLLIIGGPKNILPPGELEKLKDYLQQGGRLLACLDVNTANLNIGLEAILAKWGVEVGHNYVRDPARSSDQSDKVLSVTDFNLKHPLVNPMRDKNVLPEKSPIPLMAAVEKDTVKGVFTGRGLTRIVVIGDSYLLANAYVGGWEDNHYFADRLVNWLLDQTELLQGVGPRSIPNYSVSMTNAELQRVQLLFLAGLPGAILLLGGLVWLRRRH